MHFTELNGQGNEAFSTEFNFANQNVFSDRSSEYLVGLLVTDTIFYLHTETTHFSNDREEKLLEI